MPFLKLSFTTEYLYISYGSVREMLQNLKFNYYKNADSITTGYARGMVPTINADKILILIRNKNKSTLCYFKTVLFIKPFLKGYTSNNSECYTVPASVTDYV